MLSRTSVITTRIIFYSPKCFFCFEINDLNDNKFVKDFICLLIFNKSFFLMNLSPVSVFSELQNLFYHRYLRLITFWSFCKHCQFCFTWIKWKRARLGLGGLLGAFFWSYYHTLWHWHISSVVLLLKLKKVSIFRYGTLHIHCF